MPYTVEEKDGFELYSPTLLFKFTTFTIKKQHDLPKLRIIVGSPIFASFLNIICMASSCLVYSPHLTPRLTYTFNFLLGHCFSQPVQYTQQPQDLLSASGIRINYSENHELPCDLHLLPAGLLFDTGVRAPRPAAYQQSETFGFFPVATDRADWPFDVASAAFYLLSRYEEYQFFPADMHGRFPAAASLMAHHHVLHRPLINEWIQVLRSFFRHRGIALTATEPKHEVIPTYDIDLAWAYRHRPWWRQLGAFTRDSFRWDWDTLQDRLAVLTKGKMDPYDTFSWLAQLHRQLELPAYYFWLMGRYGPYDRNVSPTHPAYQHLFERVCADATCGLHPSYRSNTQPAQLAAEIAHFTRLAGDPPIRSRQHFLLLRFPETYRSLRRAGIRHDYSLGFPEQPGFRAGYGGTFAWYDLMAEQATDLLLTPFSIMDGTLFRYMRLTAKEALPVLRDLLRRCRQNQAQLVTLWHNSSFHEREGWNDMRGLYQTFLAEAAENRRV